MSDDTNSNSNNDSNINSEFSAVKIPYTYDLVEDASRILTDFFTPLEKEYIFICQDQEIQVKEVFSDFGLLSLLIFDKQPLLNKVCELFNEHSGKNIYHAQLNWIENSDAYLGFVPDIAQNIKPSKYPILLNALVKSIALPKTLSLTVTEETGARKIVNLDVLAENLQSYALTIKPVVEDEDDIEDIKENSDLSSSVSSDNKTSHSIKIENLISHITPSPSMVIEDDAVILALDEAWLDKKLEKYIPALKAQVEYLSKIKISYHANILTEILAYLPAWVTYEVMKYIDSNHSGLSFQFVMEARQDENAENQIFIDRIKYFFENNLQSKLFAPSRMRLITKLLEDDKNNTQNSMSYQQIMHLRESALTIDATIRYFLMLENDDDDNGEQ